MIRYGQCLEIRFPAESELGVHGIVDNQARGSPSIEDGYDAAGGSSQQVRQIALSEAACEAQALCGTAPPIFGKVQYLAC